MKLVLLIVLVSSSMMGCIGSTKFTKLVDKNRHRQHRFVWTELTRRLIFPGCLTWMPLWRSPPTEIHFRSSHYRLVLKRNHQMWYKSSTNRRNVSWSFFLFCRFFKPTGKAQWPETGNSSGKSAQQFCLQPIYNGNICFSCSDFIFEWFTIGPKIGRPIQSVQW